jgi:hypothetical protein
MLVQRHVRVSFHFNADRWLILRVQGPLRLSLRVSRTAWLFAGSGAHTAFRLESKAVPGRLFMILDSDPRSKEQRESTMQRADASVAGGARVGKP